MNEQDEAIVRRFGLQEENLIAVDNTIAVSEWGASKEQIYEFQIAFDIVGDGAKQINEQQVNDLFLAIGYTMQDFELEILFQKCIRGEGGTFTCEVLLEGLSSRILYDTIGAIILKRINSKNVYTLIRLYAILLSCFLFLLYFISLSSLIRYLIV